MAVTRNAVGYVTLLAASVVLAGCSSSGTHTGQHSPTTPAPTASASSAPPAAPMSPDPSPSVPASAGAQGLPSCGTGQLTITVGGGSGGAAGSTITAVNFTNHSSTSCVLNGFPGVSFVTGPTGHQVGPAARRTGAAAPITLKPGGLAHAALRIVSYQNYDAGTCRPTPTAGFRIYPPNQTEAAFVSYRRTACANTDPADGLLEVQAAKSGPPSD